MRKAAIIPVLPKNFYSTNETTDFEDRFFRVIYKHLLHSGYRGEIQRNVLFYRPLTGEYKRPDIYLPQFGVVIEIDGATHFEFKPGKYHRGACDRLVQDGLRDDFYEFFGLWVVRLPHEWIANPYLMRRFISDILNAFRTDSKFKMDSTRRAYIKRKISYGRKRFIELAIPSPPISWLTSKTHVLMDQKKREFTLVSQKYYGGRRYFLHRKSVTNLLSPSSDT